VRHITRSNRGFASSLAVISLVALGLAGCSGNNSVTAFDLSDDIPAMTCDRPVGNDTWSEVSSEISRLDASSAPGERNQLRDWGLDPEADLEPARKALQAKAAECPTTPPSPSASSSASTAASEFVIKLPKRDGNRLNANGVDPSKRGKAEAFRDQIADQAKHDPLTLYAYYMASPLGKAAPLKNEAVLAKDGKIIDGNVYSPKGEQVYRDWLAMWDSPLTKISPAKEIKWQGANTGVNGVSVTQSDGVGGKDKSGYDIQYVNAQGEVVGEHSALDRCTQPTLPPQAQPFKPGKTDNPPKTPPTTEECVEIPNNGVVDCGGAKVESDEPQRRGNVPEQVQGPGAGLPESNASEPEVTRPKATTVNTPPPAPKPSETKRPAPPPPVEPSAPPTSNPEPSPTVDPCTVNPDFCD